MKKSKITRIFSYGPLICEEREKTNMKKVGQRRYFFYKAIRNAGSGKLDKLATYGKEDLGMLLGLLTRVMSEVTEVNEVEEDE